MDRLNARIAAAIQARAGLVREIAGVKSALGLPAADPRREREMMREVLAHAPAGFERAALERVLRELFRASRALAVAIAREQDKRRR